MRNSPTLVLTAFILLKVKGNTIRRFLAEGTVSRICSAPVCVCVCVERQCQHVLNPYVWTPGQVRRCQGTLSEVYYVSRLDPMIAGAWWLYAALSQ
jgi:hypothetical protein